MSVETVKVVTETNLLPYIDSVATFQDLTQPIKKYKITEYLIPLDAETLAFGTFTSYNTTNVPFSEVIGKEMAATAKASADYSKTRKSKLGRFIAEQVSASYQKDFETMEADWKEITSKIRVASPLYMISSRDTKQDFISTFSPSQLVKKYRIRVALAGIAILSLLAIGLYIMTR